MPIKKLVNKLIRKKKQNTTIELPIISDHKYQILTDNISQNAINSLKKLHRANYQAYLVGGSVRDLLLRIAPKDIDIATNAKPEEMYKLFRNCRLIGRRFKLAHLLFNREIIEVATFRAGDKKKHKTHHKTNQVGMVIRDNVYGNIEDDAWRRDFTINALYYDAINNTLIDFCDGFEDIKRQTLRIIGDPKVRYREDPVRMLRAIRFAAKLDFGIEKKTSEAIHNNNKLIHHVSSVRLFDEVVKLFHSNNAEKTYSLLTKYGLFQLLFPSAYSCIQHNPGCEKLLLYTLQNTDNRIRTNKPVTPAFLFVALLWHPTLLRAKKLRSQGMTTTKSLDQASREIIAEQIEVVSISKRFIKSIREIWSLQNRLIRRRGKTPLLILTHPRFRAGYDFLILRAKAGEVDQSVVNWWTTFQATSKEKQQEMLDELHIK